MRQFFNKNGNYLGVSNKNLTSKKESAKFKGKKFESSKKPLRRKKMGKIKEETISSDALEEKLNSLTEGEIEEIVKNDSYFSLDWFEDDMNEWAGDEDNTVFLPYFARYQNAYTRDWYVVEFAESVYNYIYSGRVEIDDYLDYDDVDDAVRSILRNYYDDDFDPDYYTYTEIVLDEEEFTKFLRNRYKHSTDEQKLKEFIDINIDYYKDTIEELPENKKELKNFTKSLDGDFLDVTGDEPPMY